MNSSLRDEDYIKFLQDQGTLNCLFNFLKKAFTKACLTYAIIGSTVKRSVIPRPPVDMFIIEEKTLMKLSNIKSYR